MNTTEIIKTFNPVEWDNEGNPLFSESQLAEAIELSNKLEYTTLSRVVLEYNVDSSSQTIMEYIDKHYHLIKK